MIELWIDESVKSREKWRIEIKLVKFEPKNLVDLVACKKLIIVPEESKWGKSMQIMNFNWITSLIVAYCQDFQIYLLLCNAAALISAFINSSGYLYYVNISILKESVVWIHCYVRSSNEIFLIYVLISDDFILSYFQIEYNY